MKSALSQSQLGVYYACVANNDNNVSYQNALLVALPSVIDLNRFRKAVYDALCAHPYLASHVVLDNNGLPQMESGTFPGLEETVPVFQVSTLDSGAISAQAHTIRSSLLRILTMTASAR